MIRPHTAARLAGLAALALISGCHKAAPSGQVIATVNGEDITSRDLQAEMAAANLPPNIDAKAIAPIVVARIIDRKLVAAEAHKLEIDKSPDYLAQSQRASEVVLGQETLKRWAGGVPKPGKSDIDAFVKANPYLFGDRLVGAVVQLQTAPTDIDIRSFAPLKTFAEVQAALEQRGVKFRMSRSTIDTAQLTPEGYAQFKAAQSGEPVVSRQGDMVVVSSITETRPAPPPEAHWPEIAEQRLRQIAVAQKIEALRKSAKIEYQKGYAPPAGPSGNAPAAPKAD